MPTRREFLKTVASTAALVPITEQLEGQEAINDKHTALLTENESLRTLAARKNMFFGAATAEDRIISDIPYRTALVKECGMIVPEYEMKWDKMRPTATTYNFADADFLVNYAEQNGLAVRGHTLCWHRALPNWAASTLNRSNAERFLTEHIATVCGRYRGRIHSWDVVNEAIEPSDRQTNYLRNSLWFQLLGESYIETAFCTAAQADPSTMLVYNEYGVEFDDNVRRDAILGLLRRLKARNVPIHALGIQGHMRYSDLAKFSQHLNAFRTFLREVAALGLFIIITEFDCDDRELPSALQARDEGVGKMYGEYCSVVMNEPAVIGFITWGLTDKYTSLNATAPRPDRQAQRPLPLDSSMVRKSPWYALEFWFNATSVRPARVISAVQHTPQSSGDSPHIRNITSYPNPASDACTIEFTLPVPEDMLVRLVDIRGRDVMVIARAQLPSGTHILRAELAMLPAGAYTCIAQGSSFLAMGNIVVQR